MTRWTIRTHDTYATLHRDNSDIPTARFHVIAEAEAVCRALNQAEGMRAALEGRVRMYLAEADRWTVKGNRTAASLSRAKAGTLKAAIAALKEDTNA